MCHPLSNAWATSRKTARAQCAFLKACHDLIDNTMRVLDRGVAVSKAKLVVRDKVGKFHIGPKSLQEFLKDLRQNGEKRLIGRHGPVCQVLAPL